MESKEETLDTLQDMQNFAIKAFKRFSAAAESAQDFENTSFDECIRRSLAEKTNSYYEKSISAIDAYTSAGEAIRRLQQNKMG